MMDITTYNKEKLEETEKSQKEIQEISQLSLKMMLKMFLTMPSKK